MLKKLKNRTLYPLKIEFEREEDGRWIAEISKLPGAMAYGKTKKEAAKQAYIIALRILADNIERGRTPLFVSHLFGHELAHR